MSDISTKLTYLNTTKSQLKDQINYGLPTEKQITSSTTFREYVGSIFEAFLEALRNPDTLFTNLPKTSGSGSQITLNGTANAPMRINLNPTAITQETTLGSNLVDFLNPTNVTQGSYDSTTKVYTSNALTGNWKGLNIYVNATPISVPTGNSTFYYSADIRLKSGTYANNISVMRTGTNLTDVTSSVIGTTNPTISSSFQRYVFKVDYVNSSGSEVTYVNHYLQLKTNADNAVLEVKNIMVSKTNTDYEIYTYGASPNPSYPQDIHTISGNNSVVVEGKNLFDKTKITSNKLVSRTDGTLGNSDNYGASDFIPVVAGSQYTFTNFNYWYTAVYDKNKNYLSNVDNTRTITIPTGAYYLRSSFLLNDINSVQFEKGSTATTYTPYVLQTNPINLGEYELGTIGNYSNEFVRSDGETNLFDGTKVETTNTTNWGVTFANNVLTIQHKNSYSTGSPTYEIGTLPNGTYIMSFVGTGSIGLYLDNTYNKMLTNGTTFSVNGSQAVKFTFSADANTTITFTNIQLELGETATDYVPYEKGWYYKQGIGKVVLDGTESWGTNTAWNYTNTNVYQTGLNLSSDTLLSSHFTYNATAYSKDINGLMQRIWNTNFLVRIDNTTCPDIESFKTWLSTHNTIVYYGLATPTYTKITGELAQELEQVYKGMLSYDGTTNISQVNNDLAFGLVGSAITK